MGKSVLTEVKIIDLYVIFVEFSDWNFGNSPYNHTKLRILERFNRSRP